MKLAGKDDEGLHIFVHIFESKHTFEQHRGWKVAVSWLNPAFFFPYSPVAVPSTLIFVSLAKESTFTRGSLRSLDWKRQSVSENLEAFSWIPYVFFGTVRTVCLAWADAGYINPMEHRESLDPVFRAFYLGTRELVARQTPVIVWSGLLSCPIISQNWTSSPKVSPPLQLSKLRGILEQSKVLFCYVSDKFPFNLLTIFRWNGKHKGYYVFWVNVQFSWTVILVLWDVHVVTALVLASCTTTSVGVAYNDFYNLDAYIRMAMCIFSTQAFNSIHFL